MTKKVLVLGGSGFIGRVDCADVRLRSLVLCFAWRSCAMRFVLRLAGWFREFVCGFHVLLGGPVCCWCVLRLAGRSCAWLLYFLFGWAVVSVVCALSCSAPLCVAGVCSVLLGSPVCCWCVP